MYIQLLSWAHHTEVFFTHWVKKTASLLRKWLGPEPTNYLILHNGDVIQSNTLGVDEYLPTALLYETATEHISHALAPLAGRYRSVPLLGISLLRMNKEPIDISDWLGNIRMNPVVTLPPKVYVALWSKVKNVYVPYTQLEVTDSTGEISYV